MKFQKLADFYGVTTSPSMRREWIEMKDILLGLDPKASPSMRREWIEILLCSDHHGLEQVSLHAEGVD